VEDSTNRVANNDAKTSTTAAPGEEAKSPVPVELWGGRFQVYTSAGNSWVAYDKCKVFVYPALKSSPCLLEL